MGVTNPEVVDNLARLSKEDTEVFGKEVTEVHTRLRRNPRVDYTLPK